MKYLGTILKTTKWSWFISKANHSTPQRSRQCSNHWCQRSWSWPFLWRHTAPTITNTKEDVLFIIECKSWKSKTPGVTVKFGLGVQNEVGQSLSFFKRTHWSYQTAFSNNTRDDFTYQFSSVTQSCPTLCDPMNLSTPGLPVHHQLPEFTQTHIHRVGDTIQLSHPLSSPFPPAPNPS